MKVTNLEVSQHGWLGEMIHAEVESSVILKFYWSNITGDDDLVVTFKSGARYRYHNVPILVFIQLISSDSVGETFNKIVRNNYEYYLVPAN
jgi:hypothetical protein